MAQPPLPPSELALRVGIPDRDDPLRSFDDLGRRLRDLVVSIQPDGWFDGKRILDFGCGSGKLLRHLLPEAERCEIWGCDIDADAVRWVETHLSPPLHVFVSDVEPPLPLESLSFDLVLAMSVFTHLTESWARWLLELHRLLRPGGRVIASFLGKGIRLEVPFLSWAPDATGMNVVSAWQPWSMGGPTVAHSEWWLRAHWGRLFEIVSIEDDEEGHGFVVLERDDRPPPTAAELEEPEPGERREVLALRANLAQLWEETRRLAADRDAQQQAYDEAYGAYQELLSEYQTVREDQMRLRRARDELVERLHEGRRPSVWRCLRRN